MNWGRSLWGEEPRHACTKRTVHRYKRMESTFALGCARAHSSQLLRDDVVGDADAGEKLIPLRLARLEAAWYGLNRDDEALLALDDELVPIMPISDPRHLCRSRKSRANPADLHAGRTTSASVGLIVSL